MNQQPKVVLKVKADLVMMPNGLLDVIIDIEGSLGPCFIDALTGGIKRILEKQMLEAIEANKQPKIQIAADMPGIRNRQADLVQ